MSMKNTLCLFKSHMLTKKYVRHLSESSSTQGIIEKMNNIVPKQRIYFKSWKSVNQNKVLNKEVTVQQAFGMKGITCLITETSLLDPIAGIKYRGYTVPEVTKRLPKTKACPAKVDARNLSPLPEGMLWLLLTGEIPTSEEVESVSKELLARSDIPKITEQIVDMYPKEMHPMVQLSGAVLSMSPYSKFRKAYFERVPKADLWMYTLEDVLDLIARIPVIAARIYCNVYHGGKYPSSKAGDDWSSNFARLLGFEQFEFFELMRLLLTLHSDHEGGNVSAHTCHLVGSALSDPFQSFSAAINGLSGPLHGLANQEVLEMIKYFDKSLPGDQLNVDSLSKMVKNMLNAGQVIPGFGHSVLRVTDSRFKSQQEFAAKYLRQDDRLYMIVRMLHEIVPVLLTDAGKASNPYPNTDLHIGVLLNYFGLTEPSFFTAMFAVSRSIGILSNLVIDRVYGMPLERPKSVTTKWISENIK